MEVLSFISSEKCLIEYFGSFMLGYERLSKDFTDQDTVFYVNPKTGRNEIYFHFLPTNLEEEFTYNYTEEDQTIIKSFFGEGKLHSFDIQFGNEEILNDLLNSFINYLRRKGYNFYNKTLISHPFKGIVNITSFEV